MSDILQLVLTAVLSVLTTGGIGSIFFFRQNKKLKNAEVKSADLENLKRAVEATAASSEEWRKLYEKVLEEYEGSNKEIDRLNDKIELLHEAKENSWEEVTKYKVLCEKKEREIKEHEWYRCEINGCPYRRPPRVYGDMDFPKGGLSPVENPDPNVL